MRHSLYVLLLIVILSAAGTAAAQDSHYWTNAYGTRGQLVGGVVIGSIVDLSSTFYNPGAITIEERTNQFAFSYLTRYDSRQNDSIYQIDQRDVLDWAGGGLDDFTGTYNGELRVYEGWGKLSWSWTGMATGMYVCCGRPGYFSITIPSASVSRLPLRASAYSVRFRVLRQVNHKCRYYGRRLSRVLPCQQLSG